MRSSSWLATFIVCALLGTTFGYVVTLVYKPSLLPPVLRIGGLTTPMTIVLLGTDIVYSKERRHLKADKASYQGRSDTIMVARLDPIRNSVTMLSIPRDTVVKIPGHGHQKINAANALGGPQLVADTLWELLGTPIDHYLVLNVHGLVELVDELDGLNVEVPKRMKYVDHSAKLKIDLQPGPHKLNGEEAMGFVRFRHDELGDIGRVQRQELFLRAVQEKALDPSSWAKVPKLLGIAQKYILSDMDGAKLMQIASFARSVPKANQTMIMMPGNFSGSGDWAVSDEDVQTVVSRLLGKPIAASTRDNIRITVENATSNPDGGRRLYKYLLARGYNVVSYKQKSDVYGAPLTKTRIIAQRGNTEDAVLIRGDLRNQGDIVNASVGDIQSAVTIIAGDDVSPCLTEEAPSTVKRKRSRHH